jgi:DNA-binding Lrp family transcriptional regulator
MPFASHSANTIDAYMISDTDHKILVALERGAYRPDAETIAPELKTTNRFFWKTVESFLEKRIIRKFTIDINYGKVGFSTHAISVVKLKDQSSAESFVEKIKKIREAVEVYTVFGEQDYCIRWLCRDPDHTMHVIDQIKSDVHIETFIFGEECKPDSRVGLLQPPEEKPEPTKPASLERVLVSVVLIPMVAVVGWVLYRMLSGS